MKITSKHPDVWPEHCKCTPNVDLEVGHEEAVREGVRQLVCIKVGMDETKEDIVGFPAFVGQEADDKGEVAIRMKVWITNQALEFLLRAG